MLYPDPSSQPVFPIQISDSILSITQILKLTKAISSLNKEKKVNLVNVFILFCSHLQYDVPNPAIALEELFHIPISGVFRDISKIHFVVSRHSAVKWNLIR